jgi:periplasmic divalent cation tolerance protein
MSAETLLVITSLPDRASADALARALVERRAAACVNILAPCTSVYRWKGAVETAEEYPLFAKTTRDRYSLLERVVRELHPYELPEIIAVAIERGLPAYLDWVAAEASPPR